MPLQRCKHEGRWGWQFGKSGKCYTGVDARRKALRQARAIGASGYRSVSNAERTKVVPSNPLKADPTRSATLRKQFMRVLRVRFDKLKREVIKLVDEEDAFGLKTSHSLLNVQNQRFIFATIQERVTAFRNWLAVQMQSYIVPTTEERPDDAYWKAFVEEGYRKGAGRAFDDTRVAQRAAASGSAERLSFYQGTKEEFLRSAFGRPVAIEKVKLLAGRVYTELKGITDRIAQVLTRGLTDGMAQGDNPRTIAKRLADEIDIGKHRAETIARTEIIRSHAEGQLDALEQMGIEEVGVAVEWSTAGDMRVCDLCGPLEGIVMKLSEARGLIPRHPNAVFEGSTFAPYGEALELVRAWYDGPSVVLLAGDYRTTIGPNHPVMTRRGMVVAAEIREGDEVLYDLWHDSPNRIGFPDKPYLEEIKTVEDVFESSVSILGNSFVTSSGSDLHGDREFCQGEVEAIRPVRELLYVLDSCGIEKLRKHNFVFSDPDLILVPGLSSLPFGKGGVFLPSTSSMGSSNAWVLTNDRFLWVRVHTVLSSRFSGWAFDATTHSSLYCNDGFVVSNCRCAHIPANVGEDPKKQVRSKSAIEEALDKSISAEGSKKRSLEEKRKRSTWVGADRTVAKKRPKGLV